MAMLPPKQGRKLTKGQTDHLDAWVISYADLITLLFMLFVIIVSVSVAKHNQLPVGVGDQEYGLTQERSGTMSLGTPYDETYRNLVGLMTSSHADQNMAVEKSSSGVWIDIAAASFFAPGSVDVPREQLGLIKAIADSLKGNMTGDYLIEVEGHTDDEFVKGSPYDNWELAATRAAHIVQALINEGIDPAHLRAVSYAGVRPLVPNLDIVGNPIPKNRSRNQRIVIRLRQASGAVAADHSV